MKLRSPPRPPFTEVVPRTDTAGALASLDVLSSAVGVVAPLAGGFVFEGVAPGDVPLVAAGLYAALAALVAACFSAPTATGIPAAPRPAALAPEAKKDS